MFSQAVEDGADLPVIRIAGCVHGILQSVAGNPAFGDSIEETFSDSCQR